MDGLRRLIAAWEHSACVVEAVVRRREGLEISRHAMRLAEFGSGGDHSGELRECPEQLPLAFVSEQSRVVAGLTPADAEISRIAQHGTHASVGVLHVEDRIVVRPLHEQVEVESEG